MLAIARQHHDAWLTRIVQQSTATHRVLLACVLHTARWQRC
jgi:hypothetical protein